MMLANDPWAEFPDADGQAAPGTPAPSPSPTPAPANDTFAEFPDAGQAPPAPEADPYAKDLDTIANEVDAEFNAPADAGGVDKSRVIATDPSRGDIAVSSTVKTVKNPWVERHGAQLGRMVAGGVPDADIIDFVKETGTDPATFNLDQILQYRHSPEYREWKRQNPNKPYPVQDTMEVPLNADEQADAALAASPVGSAFAGALDTETLGFADELAGLAGQDTEEFRKKQELSAAANPGSYIVGQVAGGALLPTQTLSAAKTAAAAAFREALATGVARMEAKQIARDAARRAIVAQATKEGAAFGGGYGAGSANGDILDRAAGAGSGALIGAATAGATAKAGTSFSANRELARSFLLARAPTDAQEVARAAGRQGIDLLPADVGGPVTRRLTGITAQTIGGVQPIKAAASRMVEQTAAARDRIATSFGEALRPEAAGQQGLLGARSTINSTRNEARAFYASAEKATEGFKAKPEKAIAELDKNIAELSETPGGADGLRTLQAIRDDLSNGKVTVRGIRQMRTTLRDQFAKDGLRGSDIERRVNGIVDAAAQDVTESLSDAGKKEAAQLFAKGDRAWKDRADLIDNVFKPIIGTRENPRSGEQVIKTLTADLQGNNARAVKFLNAMAPEQQGNIRASIIGNLGRATKGQQNAEGDAFSLSTFLTNWNEIGESAKAAYFGPEGRAALNDLAKVAQGAREAQGYSNFSNTGSIPAGIATMATTVGGLPTFVATIGAQYGLGRLLASPRFARWLARAPKSSLSPPAYIDRLSRIAKAEPAIASDVLGLQQRLLDTFSGSAPARLAADEPVNAAAGVSENQQGQEDQYPGEELPQ